MTNETTIAITASRSITHPLRAQQRDPFMSINYGYNMARFLVRMS